MCDDLTQAFEATHYHVLLDHGRHRLHIGLPCPDAIAAWLARHGGTPCAWLITGYNPAARPINDAHNRARERWLRAWAQAHARAWLPSVNAAADDTWPDEPGVLIAGVEEGQARALARRLGQLAMVAVSADRPARLVWCS